MTARLLLVRHGQSTWNADGRWQGTEDPPLSDLGTRQAHHAATVVGGFDAFVASDLERARHTAEIIANEHGLGPVITDPDLRERCAGAFQGLTKDQIDEQFPGYRDQHRQPPGWESDEAVIARAIGALARIASRVGDDGTAFVVSHGGLIMCIERLLGLPRDGRLANLGGRWFAIGVDDAGRPSLVGEDAVELIAGAEHTVPDQI